MNETGPQVVCCVCGETPTAGFAPPLCLRCKRDVFREPGPTEDALKQCDCCGQMKPDVENVSSFMGDTSACAACRGED